MDGHQFGDLPLIQGMDEHRFSGWAMDQNSYTHTYWQHEVSFRGEDIYFDAFENGVVSMQPMQRFMVDSSPLTQGMLHAKIPVNGGYERPFEQHWPSTYCSRNESPDRDSSGHSSHNSQDELRSPQSFPMVLHGSPMEYFQPPLPYATPEIFPGRSYSPVTPVHQNISLRDVEYEHPEPETIVEEIDEIDDAEIKQEAVCDHEHVEVKTENTTREYADSGIGCSVRDAQSVEPVDFPEEAMSDDSDYSPSTTSRRRRRSTGSNSSSCRSQKRRAHNRKGVQATATAVPARSHKRARRVSKASKCSTDASDQRQFPCPLAAYGCKSDFAAKNEWKRHVSTQHIKLGFWRCDLCPPSADPNDGSFYPNDFNRKDLFTQHLRRMHAAPREHAQCNQKAYPVTEENLAEHQTRCNRKLRKSPQHSGCLFCDHTFEGPKSWDERMEHLGKHFEKDGKSRGDRLDTATWNLDERLERYLVDEGLIIREEGVWKIGNGTPQRGAGVDSEVESEEEE